MTKQLVFCAISVALAFVTSYIKFMRLPFGGSITLFSMFFLCFAGYLFGPKTGICTGVAYGLLQFLQDPYLYSIGQFFLDYPLAFACLGMAGFCRNQKWGLQKGIFLGVCGRYLCHVLSGYIFFDIWMPESFSNPAIYSVVYNGTYMLPELVSTVIAIIILYKTNAIKRLIKEIEN